MVLKLVVAEITLEYGGACISVRDYLGDVLDHVEVVGVTPWVAWEKNLDP
jgi:hypothetical protein